jgi:Holliday junction resolvasome RuvABC endonuclease subunit
MPVFLGIDGGFALTGYALVSYRGSKADLRVLEMGLLETTKSARKVPVSEDNVRRARLLTKKLKDLIGEPHASDGRGYFEGVFPSCICSEAMSYPRSSSTACKLGISWGIVSALAETRGFPIVQVSPQDLKYICTGSRTASKGELRARLSLDYPSSMEAFEKAEIGASKAEHCWDALGAIIACLDTEIVRALVKHSG